jgi:hypothetical protein
MEKPQKPFKLKWTPKADITQAELVIATPYLSGQKLAYKPEDLPQTIRRHFTFEGGGPAQ